MAVNVPVASNGPEIFSVEFAAFSHVAEAAPPTMPPAAVEVTIPLLVTVIPVLIVHVPVSERLAAARNECAALTVVAAAMVPVPPIVALAPESITGSVPAPPRFPVPLTKRFPAMVNVPAAVAVVTVTPVFTVTLPKETFVVGVTVDAAANVLLLPALSVNPPVAETVTLFAKFRFAPATVVRIGATDPPDANE